GSTSIFSLGSKTVTVPSLLDGVSNIVFPTLLAYSSGGFQGPPTDWLSSLTHLFHEINKKYFSLAADLK
ncbi:MAG: hypothetical protein OQJ78_06945, partial [Ignavibacteriaceae bacterium]|nr:hypothetical protein [Ignavibacteriaceae bacterium]